MREMAKPIIAAVMVTLLTILWSFFFQTLGLTIDFFLTPNMDAFISQIFNLNTWLFLITFGLPFAAAAGFSLYGNKIYYTLFSVVGAIISMAIAYTIFPVFKSYFLLIPFYIIAIAITSYMSNPPFEGMSKFGSLKALNKAVQLGLLILAVGVFITVFLTVSSDQKGYLNKFETALTEGIEGELEDAVDASIKQQNSFIFSIMNTPQYLNLTLKQDEEEDIKAFVIMMQGIVENLNSDDTLNNAIEEQQDELDVHALLSEKIPGYDLISANLAIFHALSLFLTFLFVRSIIFRPIAVGFGWVFAKVEETVY